MISELSGLHTLGSFLIIKEKTHQLFSVRQLWDTVVVKLSLRRVFLYCRQFVVFVKDGGLSLTVMLVFSMSNSSER